VLLIEVFGVLSPLSRYAHVLIHDHFSLIIHEGSDALFEFCDAFPGLFLRISSYYCSSYTTMIDFA
jgi:hypothetical protein